MELRRDLRNGDGIDGVLYEGYRSAAGLGLDWSSPYANGVSTLHVEYNRPNWDFTEGLVGGATRDRAAVKRSQTLYDLLGSVAEVEIGVERYRMNGATDAQSWSATGEFRTPLPRLATGLSAVYALNAEYFTEVRTEVEGDGQRFQPLPTISREIHTFSVEWTGDFALPSVHRPVQWTVSPGYSVNRFGSSGPAFSASLAFVDGPIKARLYAEHGIDPRFANQSATTIGTSIVWILQ